MWWKPINQRLTKNKFNFYLLLITILAGVLCFYRFPELPAGFTMDEAAHGYTAYSILKTGKDEWGKFLPLNPRSVGDYKLPLYAYLTIPSVAVFGLNVFAVRLPSAVLGVLAVIVTYFFVKEIGSKTLALLAAFLLAISPWHIGLSRGAFEMSFPAVLLPLGLWFYFKGREKREYLYLAFLIFGISLFSCHSLRYFLPFLLLVLFLFQKKEIWGNKKAYFKPFLVFVVFFLVNLWVIFFGGKTRVTDIGLFSPTDKWQSVADRQYEARQRGMPLFIERIFNNKITYVINNFYKNYLGYLSFDFLFTKGASEATYGMIPGRGVLYLFELPLVLFAIWKIFQNKNRGMELIFWLLLLAPIPAALAKGERAGGRAGTMMPFLQIISAYGIVELFRWTKEKFTKNYKLFLLFYFSTLLLFFVFFLEDYFYHSQGANAPAMAYGWSQAMAFIKNIDGQYDQIIISRRFSEPQIGVAFFLKWDPTDFQKKSSNWLIYEKMGYVFVDQLPQYALGKYEFRNFNFPNDQKIKKTLFVGRDEDFWGVNVGKTLKTVYYPGFDQKIAFKIVDFEP